MLEKVFWDYFKNTGNLDAYLAAKDFNNDNIDSNESINSFGDLANNTEIENNNIEYNPELSI